MGDDIDKILKNSSRAEMVEEFADKLVAADKVIIVLVEDTDDGKFSSQVMLLGISNSYEAYGILDVAKQDLQEEL